MAEASTIPPTRHVVASHSASGTTETEWVSVLLVILTGANAGLWLLGRGLGLHVVTSVTMVLAGLVGFGTAALCWTPLRGSRLLAWSIALSMSYSALLSLLMIKTHWWHPVGTAAASQALALGAAVLWLAPRRTEVASTFRLSGTRRQSGRIPAWAPPLAAVVLIAGALSVAAADSSNTRVGWSGLLGSINPAWFVLIALLSALAVTCAWQRTRSFLFVAALLGLALTLTPAIVYLSSRSQSAEKHVQLTQLVEMTGRLVSSEDAYNGWPGFFSLTAWWAQAGHIDNLYGLAAVWPAILVLPRVVAVHGLARRITSSRRAVGLAVVFELLVNCLGADYFSPQSYGYVLALLLYGILLDKKAPRPARVAMVFVATAATTVTHQLTPFIVLGAAVVLVVFRLLRPWYLLVAVAVPIGAWAALNGKTISRYVSPDSVGSASNFNLPSQESRAPIAEVVHLSIYATAVGGAVVALLALALILRRRRRVDIALAVASAVGLALVAVYAYGNEGIIRAVLFAIPWLSILAAMSVSSVRWRRVAIPVVSVTPIVLTATFMIGCFALDGGTTMRRSDVSAIHVATQYARAHPSTRVLLVSLESGDTPTSGPTQPKNLRTARVQAATPLLVSDDPTARESATQFLLNVLRLERTGVGQQVVVFVLSSPAAAVHDQQYGVASRSEQDGVREVFASSPAGTVVTDEDGTLLVRFDGGALNGLDG